jgi:hypothetical protein
VCAPLAADQALFRNASIGYGGGSVSHMKTADVNQDGKPDVILLQAFGATNVQSLMTLFGNGDGTFRAPVKTPLTPVGTAMAIGDLDGDGNVDVVLSVQYATIETYHGNGDGSFTLRSSQKPANILTGSSLVLTDLNGDGKLDLISCAGTFNSTPTALVTFRGRGDGTFDAGVTQPANSSLVPIIIDIAIGDFNGDGFTDVLESSIQLATGRGDGSFNAPTTIPTLSGREGRPIVGDFNSDGKLDYISLRAHAALIHLGHGNGKFTDGATYTTGESFSGTVADLDGDGKLDVIISGNDLVTVMRGNGDGTFAVQSYVANAFYPLAVADFDGDHHVDVLVSPTPTLLLLHGNGDGTLAAYRKDFIAPAPATEFFPLNSPSGLGAGDFDGDGKPDAVTWLDGNLIVLPNNGKGGFGAPMPLALPPGLTVANGLFAIGDVNGDGKADIVAGWSKLWAYLGNGNGTFTVAAPVAIGSYATITLADLNGDGRLDAVLGDSHSAGQLLLGNGDGTFAAPAPLPASPILIADFNGDGRLDFVSRTGAGFYEVFLNNGSGAFTVKERVSNTIGVGAVGDFNGDGKTDLIESPFYGYSRVRLGKGDGTFTNLPEFIARDGDFVTADFDGDGKLDLAFSNTVILGNGDGTFRAIVPAVASRGWGGPIAAADVDGNGSTDLLLLDTQNWTVNSLLTRTVAAGTTPFPLVVTTSFTPLHPGETVTVTATATTSSTFVPSGGIRLTVDGTFAGFAAWNNGTASLTWTPLATGDHTFVVSYIGDDVFASSTASISRRAVKLDSIIDLSVTPSPWQVQQLTGIIWTVRASQSTSTLPTGTITIREGETVVFSGPNLAKGLSYRFTTIGTHIVTAEYTGDANYTPATATFTHVVTKGIAASLALSANPASPLTAGQILALTATIGGLPTPVNVTGTVTFRDFGVEIGTVPVNAFAAASLTIQPQPGYHSYSATYNGNDLIDPAKSYNLDYDVRSLPCTPAANCARKRAAH